MDHNYEYPIEGTIITNHKTCPVCGSDTRRESWDVDNGDGIEYHVCQNGDCGISITFVT